MKYIAYYRVSTQKQGRSGLGLDAQKNIVRSEMKEGDQLLNEYTEIESGRKNNRTQLNAALHDCKKNNATLIIAKLDRLARNVSFIFSLREAGVKFLACDLPDFNTLSLGIFASFAQYESERISARIKDALKAKKARGFKLGSPAEMVEKCRVAGLATRIKNSKNILQNAYQMAKGLLGKTSLLQITHALNNAGLRTVRGKAFTVQAVKNMITLFEKAE